MKIVTGATDADRQHIADRMSDAAHGAWELFLIPYGNALSVLAASFEGDETATIALASIANWFENVMTRDEPPLCLLCDHEFVPNHQPPATFSLLVPYANRSTGVVVSAICERCTASCSGDELLRRVFEVIKQYQLPDAQITEPGRA